MASPSLTRASLALASSLFFAGCPPEGGLPDAAPDDAGAEAAAPDAAAPDRPDGGAAPACPLGTFRYAPGGVCAPADPCRDEAVCAAASRVCENEEGTAVCGRCLDGFVEDGGACVDDPALEAHVGRFRVGRDFFWRWTGARYERVFVRGVNLGGSIPGTGPNGGAIGRERYDRWLAMMSDGGVNAIRVYSLHPPALYEALDAHNRARPDRPIFLFQGVWLADPEAEQDLFDQSEAFDAVIAEHVEALHGARAPYGTDVSPWILGWLVGREVLAGEVQRTDARHPERVSYEGTTMRLAAGTPTETWVVERLDRLVALEQGRWGESRPVAFSSWMELDPLAHPTEPSDTDKDTTQIDLSRVEAFGAPAGHFVSYHVYPYYPLFVSEDPYYRALGPDGYRGVLLRLRAHHRDQALLVAEYGVPSSWGRAQPSGSGMHHGGLTEREQGDALARMTRDIRETGCAGGLAFKWQDGWWKPTWITDARTFPRERYALWHDLTTPQQSYGLLAFEPAPFAWERADDAALGAGPIEAVSMGADARALHVRIELRDPVPAAPRLVVGIDTYRDDLGDSRLPDGRVTEQRSELALELDGATARLRVLDAYDLYAIRAVPAVATFQSVARDGGAWVPLLWQMTVDHGSDDGVWWFEGQDYEVGALRVRGPGDAPTSLDAVVIEERAIELTLPWVLLQYADPSTRTVVHDDPSTAVIEGEVSDGVRLAIVYDGALVQTRRFAWPTWDEAPPTTERLKESAAIFFAALAGLL